MKFYAISINGLDDEVDAETFEAEDEEHAQEMLEDWSHNYDSWWLFNEQRFNNLRGAVKHLEEMQKCSS